MVGVLLSILCLTGGVADFTLHPEQAEAFDSLLIENGVDAVVGIKWVRGYDVSYIAVIDKSITNKPETWESFQIAVVAVAITHMEATWDAYWLLVGYHNATLMIRMSDCYASLNSGVISHVEIQPVVPLKDPPAIPTRGSSKVEQLLE